MSERYDKIVNHLRGTCDGLESALEQLGESELADDMEFLQYLDGEIFCCTQCGWWCDQDEEASEEHGLDEWTCEQCCNGG